MRCWAWAGSWAARGLAYPPSENEPPRWPAVCLDHWDALAYVAWLNAQAKAAHPTIDGRALSPAQRGGMGICRPRRHQQRALVGRRDRQRQRQLQWLRQPWDNHVLGAGGCLSPPIPSACTACWAMPGNGRRIAGIPPMSAHRPMAAPGSSRDCAKHVLRGGAWNNVPIFIRSASRSGGSDDGASKDDYDYSSLAGFRVARSFPSAAGHARLPACASAR